MIYGSASPLRAKGRERDGVELSAFRASLSCSVRGGREDLDALELEGRDE